MAIRPRRACRWNPPRLAWLRLRHEPSSLPSSSPVSSRMHLPVMCVGPLQFGTVTVTSVTTVAPRWAAVSLLCSHRRRHLYRHGWRCRRSQCCAFTDERTVQRLTLGSSAMLRSVGPVGLTSDSCSAGGGAASQMTRESVGCNMRSANANRSRRRRPRRRVVSPAMPCVVPEVLNSEKPE